MKRHGVDTPELFRPCSNDQLADALAAVRRAVPDAILPPLLEAELPIEVQHLDHDGLTQARDQVMDDRDPDYSRLADLARRQAQLAACQGRPPKDITFAVMWWALHSAFGAVHTSAFDPPQALLHAAGATNLAPVGQRQWRQALATFLQAGAAISAAREEAPHEAQQLVVFLASCGLEPHLWNKSPHDPLPDGCDDLALAWWASYRRLLLAATQPNDRLPDEAAKQWQRATKREFNDWSPPLAGFASNAVSEAVGAPRPAPAWWAEPIADWLRDQGAAVDVEGLADDLRDREPAALSDPHGAAAATLASLAPDATEQRGEPDPMLVRAFQPPRLSSEIPKLLPHDLAELADDEAAWEPLARTLQQRRDEGEFVPDHDIAVAWILAGRPAEAVRHLRDGKRTPRALWLLACALVRLNQLDYAEQELAALQDELASRGWELSEEQRHATTALEHARHALPPTVLPAVTADDLPPHLAFAFQPWNADMHGRIKSSLPEVARLIDEGRFDDAVAGLEEPIDGMASPRLEIATVKLLAGEPEAAASVLGDPPDETDEDGREGPDIQWVRLCTKVRTHIEQALEYAAQLPAAAWRRGERIEAAAALFTWFRRDLPETIAQALSEDSPFRTDPTATLAQRVGATTRREVRRSSHRERVRQIVEWAAAFASWYETSPSAPCRDVLLTTAAEAVDWARWSAEHDHARGFARPAYATLRMRIAEETEAARNGTATAERIWWSRVLLLAAAEDLDLLEPLQKLQVRADASRGAVAFEVALARAKLELLRWPSEQGSPVATAEAAADLASLDLERRQARQLATIATGLERSRTSFLPDTKVRLLARHLPHGLLLLFEQAEQGYRPAALPTEAPKASHELEEQAWAALDPALSPAVHDKHLLAQVGWWALCRAKAWLPVDPGLALLHAAVSMRLKNRDYEDWAEAATVYVHALAALCAADDQLSSPEVRERVLGSPPLQDLQRLERDQPDPEGASRMAVLTDLAVSRWKGLGPDSPAAPAPPLHGDAVPEQPADFKQTVTDIVDELEQSGLLPSPAAARDGAELDVLLDQLRGPVLRDAHGHSLNRLFDTVRNERPNDEELTRRLEEHREAFEDRLRRDIEEALPETPPAVEARRFGLPSTWEYYANGRAAYEIDEYEAAVEAFEKAWFTDPVSHHAMQALVLALGRAARRSEPSDARHRLAFLASQFDGWPTRELEAALTYRELARLGGARRDEYLDRAAARLARHVAAHRWEPAARAQVVLLADEDRLGPAAEAAWEQACRHLPGEVESFDYSAWTVLLTGQLTGEDAASLRRAALARCREPALDTDAAIDAAIAAGDLQLLWRRAAKMKDHHLEELWQRARGNDERVRAFLEDCGRKKAPRLLEFLAARLRRDGRNAEAARIEHWRSKFGPGTAAAGAPPSGELDAPLDVLALAEAAAVDAIEELAAPAEQLRHARLGDYLRWLRHTAFDGEAAGSQDHWLIDAFTDATDEYRVAMSEFRNRGDAPAYNLVERGFDAVVHAQQRAYGLADRFSAPEARRTSTLLTRVWWGACGRLVTDTYRARRDRPVRPSAVARELMSWWEVALANLWGSTDLLHLQPQALADPRVHDAAADHLEELRRRAIGPAAAAPEGSLLAELPDIGNKQLSILNTRGDLDDGQCAQLKALLEQCDAFTAYETIENTFGGGRAVRDSALRANAYLLPDLSSLVSRWVHNATGAGSQAGWLVAFLALQHFAPPVLMVLCANEPGHDQDTDRPRTPGPDTRWGDETRPHIAGAERLGAEIHLWTTDQECVLADHAPCETTRWISDAAARLGDLRLPPKRKQQIEPWAQTLDNAVNGQKSLTVAFALVPDMRQAAMP